MIIPTQGRQEIGNTSVLFAPGNIGNLALPNRLVGSATAERLADADGKPKLRLIRLYRELTRGGVGLIITGHLQERFRCISANCCWPEGPDEGIVCKCPIERDYPGEPTT